MVRRDSGRLVQIVDVLGYHRRNLAGAIKRGNRPMPAPGFGRGEGRFHGKTTSPGLVARFVAREELIEPDRTVALPHPSRRAEIGDSALCRDPGPGERHDG